MGYRSLRECLNDLEQAGHLLRVEQEIDPYLEAAEIQRRVYAAGGPALLFERVRGTRFPMASNLFGSMERMRFMFRDSLERVQRLISLKVDPAPAMRRPWQALPAVRGAWHMLPRHVRTGPVMEQTCQIADLPALTSWPKDGGPFVTLPQVYSEDVTDPSWRNSNLGMYRVQLAGNEYRLNEEIGLHYQIHRGIGVHHAKALEAGKPFRVNIFVGGPPALSVAAVMPLPEGLSELTFAGALGGRRVRLVRSGDRPAIVADADFCITGTVDPERQLPEGPFGDHLGYYSLAHDFPVLKVEQVYHRRDAIWPFTVVGRPPQEDTSFGQFIHELTASAISSVLPGVRGVHAVDAAGVHPLLLAIGSERYQPYLQRQSPQELLTQANAILGNGQLSLAKYLWIAAYQDDPALDLHDIEKFLRHMLERIDWARDLHFQTRTTIDTLDYSGCGFNQGSKVVLAAVGPPRRTLPTALSGDPQLPDGFSDPRVALPGVLILRGPRCQRGSEAQTPDPDLQRFCQELPRTSACQEFPLLVVVDDAEFTAATLSSFLWVTFTRSDPAADIYGIDAFVEQKHWGCRGSLVIDARQKPRHAPPLIEDPEVTRRVDRLAERGGPLHGII